MAPVIDGRHCPRCRCSSPRRTPTEKNRVVAFTMANSERWVRFQRRRSRPMGYLAALRRVLSVDLRPLVRHAGSVLNRLYTRMETLWTTA